MSLVPKILIESSLSRVYEHIENYDISIMTAFRSKNISCTAINDFEENHEFSKSENLIRNRDLKATLLRLKYGVTNIDGSYIEGFGEKGSKEVSENSFLIVNLNNDVTFIKNMALLGQQFCQDAILIKPQGEDAYLYGTNNSEFPGLNNKVVVGEFKGGQEAMFYSKIKGRPFVFEHFDLNERVGKEVIWKISQWYIEQLNIR